MSTTQKTVPLSEKIVPCMVHVQDALAALVEIGEELGDAHQALLAERPICNLRWHMAVTYQILIKLFNDNRDVRIADIQHSSLQDASVSEMADAHAAKFKDVDPACDAFRSLAGL